ncbi:hypothetical protein F7725_000077 [Dissostichus mawsoni]|uniref:Uncharacterized protein n=1 Tax=Dissostichus mawsoni TaxID=36200 RepID=A0A7J5ZDB1_DISMA|nr:hypothetical protein F7725_000077 [Dissostichus mawsoni]
MSPKETKLRAGTVPGSTADIKERIWKQLQELLKQWQTRGLIPADDQPGPTKAHRKAVVEYENERYLHQQEAWVKAGRPSWYGPEKSAINKSEIEKQQLQFCYSI